MASGSKPGEPRKRLPGIRPLTPEERQWLLDNDPAYRRLVELQEMMRAKYGQMDESWPLIREDRDTR